MIYITCGKCGSYLGRVKDQYEERTLRREHVTTCEG